LGAPVAGTQVGAADGPGRFFSLGFAVNLSDKSQRVCRANNQTGAGVAVGHRLGERRLEMIVPRSVFDELRRREQVTGIYRTRIAAAILERKLLFRR
jgi:hypothetical protein